MLKSAYVLSLFLSLLLFLPQITLPAPLPKATLEILKKVKLDPSILADIEEELTVPKEWIEKAKKEGKLIVRSTPMTPTQQRTLFGPFNERYPFLKTEYLGTSQRDRTIKTLVAYKSGRILADVLASIGGYFHAFKEANALEDLSQIPNLRNVPEKAKDPKGLWVGINRHFWCLAYNTRLVNKNDLPKRWEDLLTIPKWRNGNLALGNRPQLWAMMIWQAKGEKWTKNFLTRLFRETQPQLRKEGMFAIVGLLAAGEFYGAVPALDARVQQLALRGAPVGFTCPEPAPVAPEDVVILRGAPHIYAARLYVNWLLSKEGQIAYYAAQFYAPIHRDLQLKQLTPFADQILGKEVSYRGVDLELEVAPKLNDFWNTLWLGSRR